MTLSIRSILFSLSALLAVSTLPACDTDDELEALGVDIADIDAMSEEELDELAHAEEHAFDLATPPSAPRPPLPRPTGPSPKLVPTGSDADIAPFFHTEDLLAGDKLARPDAGDDGCAPNGDELELAVH